MSDTELDRTKKLALTIKETIEVSTPEQREKLLDDLYRKWIVKPDAHNNMFDYLKLALANFNLSIDNLQLGLFERAKKVVMYELTYLKSLMMKEDLDDERKTEYEETFTKLFRAVIDADNAISSSLYLTSSMTLEDIGKEKNTHQELFRYQEIDYDSLTAFQSLLLYLTEQLHKKEYRRYVVDDKGMCYQKIFNEKGYDTHAWKPAMTIKQFILEVCRKDWNFKMWQNLTNAKENLRGATEHLTVVPCPEFEDLVRERNIFSFQNGVYITKIWSDEAENWVDQWIPFEGPGTKKLGASIVSCKLFELEFADCSNYDDWFDIIKNNCPNFTTVMNFQEWPEEVQKWLCIFIGRMLYDVGDLDDWQVMPYLLGMAGTGKCLRRGSKVMVYSGRFKKVEDIKVGDKLMGDDSTPRIVQSVCRGRDKMYRVKQVNGDDYIVNGDHILSLKMTYINHKPQGKKQCTHRIINAKKYQVGDIVDISVNDYLTLSQGQKKALKGYKVPIIFSEKEVPVDPYILGLWLGDGHSNGVGFTNQDATILKFLTKKLPDYECYLQFHPNDTSGYGYRINGNGSQGIRGQNFIMRTLVELDLINNKHIPDIYKYNSRENQLKLLAGLIDTDGHYDGGCFEIIQKNYGLAMDIQYVARCLGFSAKVVKCQKKCYKPDGTQIEGTYWRQHISGNGIEKIPCLIPRKQAHVRQQIKNNLHTGITVEPLEDDYFGFQIDGNQRFVLGDHTVTHNSTILENIVKLLYEAADVGVLSSNMEKKFGLSALVNKKIFIGPEIRGNLALDQSEFQSMISGETVQVNTKFKVAHSQPFKTPGMVAGNELPQYTDTSGSITRRIPVFSFTKKVKKGGDTKLGYKIQKELAFIIQACNKGYLDAIDIYGTSGIWEILPKYFKDNQEQMASDTNALTNFLNSDLVILGDTTLSIKNQPVYCREKIFVEVFNAHVKEHHFTATKWTDQFFSGPFADFGIKSVKNTRRRYPNKPNEKSYTGTFIFGVDLKEIVPQKTHDSDSELEFDDEVVKKT